MARMLFKLLGQSMDCLTSAEEAAVARLSAVHQRLIFDDGRVNIKNEAGFNACVAFLDVVASTANALGLEHAPRSYRDSFTVNYRALFPDGAQHYRVDILEASIEQYAAIWVNGDKYEFSAQAIHLAGLLQESWLDLNRLLDDSLDRQQRAPAKPGKLELRKALESMDTAWANFEHVYISDLIGIEEKARMFVVQSVVHEQQLCQMEARYGKELSLHTRSEYKEVQRRLVACIARLNAVANYKRKGRDDLGAEVLFAAVGTLQRCYCEEQDNEDGKARKAARMLAADVVESFDALRVYLREVAKCLERVDPHLCNNPGLVQRLVDWEESWEVGARYVQNEGLLDSISDLVFQIQNAQQYVPALTTMCEECDVELFMVLPRILWLCFLLRPWKHVDLLRSLVPDRFPGANDDKGWHPELQELSAEFQRTLSRLSVSTDCDAVAWQILVKRAIVGSWSQDAVDPSSNLEQHARRAVDDLLHDLERWSMEVQRHCPEDWNQCSAILVQCLMNDKQPRDQNTFCV